MLLDTKLLDPFLCFMGVDMNNPLAREASIVMIRYITESNKEIREYIEKLKVIDLASESSKIFDKMEMM